MTGGASEKPYLSVVATARNDDHGGNPLYRTQLFINGLIAQCDRFKLPAELVLVEWNPPNDRPRLAEVLSWPAGEGYCKVRIVEVPNDLHARLEYSDRLPLFQMIAKNVGIRRAHGAFVLATNIDILLSDGVMRFLSERRLRPGYVYRADRLDVPAEIGAEWPIEQQLAWCAASTIRINRREGSLDLRDGVFYRIGPPLYFKGWLRNSVKGRRLVASPLGRASGLRRLAYTQAVPHHGIREYVRDSRLAGRVSSGFIWRGAVSTSIMLRHVGNTLYGFAYWFVAGFNDPRLVPGRIRRRFRRFGARLRAPLEHGDPAAVAGRRRRVLRVAVLPLATVRASWRVFRRKVRSLRLIWEIEHARLPLHTNACGDFTLMSAGDWDRTFGYIELEMYSMHIDSLQLYAAHYNGIKERFLPFPVYHVEHGGGFRPEATGQDALDATLARSAIPQVTNDDFRDFIVAMHLTGAPIHRDQPTWGFAGCDLSESDPVTAREPTPSAHA